VEIPRTREGFHEGHRPTVAVGEKLLELLAMRLADDAVAETYLAHFQWDTVANRKHSAMHV
jgi:hypothetical protein